MCPGLFPIISITQYTGIGLITHGHSENFNSNMKKINFLFYTFESELSTSFHWPVIGKWNGKLFTCFVDITCSFLLILQVHTISLTIESL